MPVRLLREVAVNFLLDASARAITRLPPAVWAAPGFAAGPWLLTEGGRSRRDACRASAGGLLRAREPRTRPPGVGEQRRGGCASIGLLQRAQPPGPPPGLGLPACRRVPPAAAAAPPVRTP